MSEVTSEALLQQFSHALQEKVSGQNDEALTSLFRSVVEQTIQEVGAETRVTQEDKVSFLSHVLTGAPFQKRYPLFGNRGAVIFQTLSPAYTQAYMKLVNAYQQGRVWTHDDAQQGVIYAAIRQLVLDDRVLLQQEQPPTMTHERLVSYRSMFPVGVQHAISHVYAQFIKDIDYLASKGSDQNFWLTP